MTAPTIDVLMATNPCVGYPRERVERVLAACGHPPTWEAFALAARDRGWEAPGDTGVSLYDLLLTALRAATPAQRRLCVVHATHLRVEAQVRRWPEVSPDVADVRRRLLAWQGDREEVCAIRSAATYAAAYYAAADAAYAAAAAAHAAYYAAADVAAEIACYAAAAAAYYAAAAYDVAADAADVWNSLLHVCRLLDGTEAP